MDVHALGSSLENKQLRAPLSYRSSVATIQAACHGEETSFPPLQNTYLEVVGSNPVTNKKIVCTKIHCLHDNCEGVSAEMRGQRSGYESG